LLLNPVKKKTNVDSPLNDPENKTSTVRLNGKKMQLKLRAINVY